MFAFDSHKIRPQTPNQLTEATTRYVLSNRRAIAKNTRQFITNVSDGEQSGFGIGILQLMSLSAFQSLSAAAKETLGENQNGSAKLNEPM